MVVFDRSSPSGTKNPSSRVTASLDQGLSLELSLLQNFVLFFVAFFGSASCCYLYSGTKAGRDMLADSTVTTLSGSPLTPAAPVTASQGPVGHPHTTLAVAHNATTTSRPGSPLTAAAFRNHQHLTPFLLPPILPQQSPEVAAGIVGASSSSSAASESQRAAVAAQAAAAARAIIMNPTAYLTAAPFLYRNNALRY